jgi:hypothetical protein
MKKLLPIILLLIILSACKKEHVKSSGTGFIGTWELRAQFGGIAGTNDHFPPGNNYLLKLNADSTFAYLESSAVITQGPFNIIKNGIAIGAEKFYGLYYNHSDSGFAIRLNGDTLKIGLDFDDGIESDYIRRQ